MTPHRENRAGWPEGNKTERCASSPRGLPACRRGAVLASALPGLGQRPPATSAAFPEEFHCLRPGARAVWGRGLLVSEDDTTRKLRLRFALCCHGDDSILAALMRPTCPRSDPDLLGKPRALRCGCRCRPGGMGLQVLASPRGTSCWATFLIMQDYQDSKHSHPTG